MDTALITEKSKIVTRAMDGLDGHESEFYRYLVSSLMGRISEQDLKAACMMAANMTHGDIVRGEEI